MTTARRAEFGRKALRTAIRVRMKLNVAPIEALCVYDAAEKLNIEIRFVDIPSMEGMYVRNTGLQSQPIILVSALRPSGRQAVTTAHELGHHVFGHGTRIDQYTADKEEQHEIKALDMEEMIANTFAGFFLMPKAAVERGFAARGCTSSTACPRQVFAVAGWLGVGYPQLVATVEGKVGEVDHVVCRVEHSPTLDQIAPLYPGVPPAPGTPEAEDEPAVAASKRLEQFRDLVTWWQFPSAPLSPWDQPAFTHGSRIRRYNGHLDQVETAIEALVADHNTSRGIIILLNPPADRISARGVPFPSFCLLQFKVQRSDSGPTLNCTAFFRKQEVRYWWLVNLAELSELQREICDGLGQKRDVRELRNIRPGSVTTIAARAHAGKSAPKVQVPRIDRYYSLSRERLVAMVNSLVWNHMPGREEYANEWLRVFFELNPPEMPDPDGLAIAHEGLEYLKDEIGRHLESSALRGDEPLRALHRTIEQLLAANQGFALLQQKEEANSEKYNTWKEAVTPLIKKVIELSYGRIVAVAPNGKKS